ncbi:MAG: S46 family peptidase, partial [Bacteroides sp.]
MKVKVLTLSLLMCSLGASADEGMWLLPDLKTQNAATMLELGLEIPIKEVYSENSISLKDAVIQFGRGCTGEVVSSKGLVFTDHHCGYGAIQKLSSVENDYLTNGYWAHAYEEELPCEGLTVTFIDQILDVTEFVEAQLAKNEAEREQNFVSSQF